jgi:hypothetical protein
MREELDILIPEPIASMHSRLFDMTEFGGALLARKNSRFLFTKASCGYLIPAAFGLRLNYSLNQDLQFIGIFNFNEKQLKSTFALLLDHQGTITGLTINAKTHFQKNKNLSTYNKSFNKIFSVNLIVNNS